MTTRANTAGRWQRERQDRMRRTPRGARSTGARKGQVTSSESGGRAVVSAPPALG